MLKAIAMFVMAGFILVSCENKSANMIELLTEEKPDSISGYVQLDGLKMYYEIHGSGDSTPLVLIHGGGSDMYVSFGQMIHPLAANRRVIGVDLQAHGRSGDRNSATSFQQDADDVAALLKQLGIEKADVFGFSNGGSTTMQLAIRHPEIVNKAIIASSFYKRDGAPPEFWEMMNKGDIAIMPQELKTAYLALGHTEAELINMHDRDAKRMKNFADWKDDDLRSIKCKSLLIAADNDVVTVEHTLKMSKLIAGSSLIILPGFHGEYLGGNPASLSYPKATIALVEEFLRQPL